MGAIVPLWLRLLIVKRIYLIPVKRSGKLFLFWKKKRLSGAMAFAEKKRKITALPGAL
jgi:hypothetical protein